MESAKTQYRSPCLFLTCSGLAHRVKVSRFAHPLSSVNPRHVSDFGLIDPGLPSLGSSCAPSTSDLGSFDGLEFAETIHFLRLGNSTASSSCPPKYNVPPLSLTAPTGVLADLPFVEIATFVAVWLGMLWICKAAFWSARPMQEKGSAGAERFVATSSRDKRKITRKQE